MAANATSRPPKNSMPPMNPQRYQAALTSKKSRSMPTPIASTTPTMPNQNFAPRPSSTSSPLTSSFRSSRQSRRSASSEQDEALPLALHGHGRRRRRRFGDGRRHSLRRRRCQARAGEVPCDVNGCRSQRRSENEPEHPEEAARADGDHKHDERIEVER